MIKIGIIGACGRMGRRIASLAVEDEIFELVCAIERQGHPEIGKKYGTLIGFDDVNVIVSESMQNKPDVLIDFSLPESTIKWVEIASAHKIPLVIGTTGLGRDDLTRIASFADNIAIVQAPNMSVGMNLLFRLAGQVAEILGDDYDIEIVEHHHRFKKDAPSGSALGILDSIANAKGKSRDEIAVFGRYGKEASRKSGEIGVHAVRLGDTVGEHSVYFGNLGETITISHSAHSRDTFARGALRAAEWIIGREARLYSMQDVLFGTTK